MSNENNSENKLTNSKRTRSSEVKLNTPLMTTRGPSGRSSYKKSAQTQKQRQTQKHNNELKELLNMTQLELNEADRKRPPPNANTIVEKIFETLGESDINLLELTQQSTQQHTTGILEIIAKDVSHVRRTTNTTERKIQDSVKLHKENVKILNDLKNISITGFGEVRTGITSIRGDIQNLATTIRSNSNNQNNVSIMKNIKEILHKILKMICLIIKLIIRIYCQSYLWTYNFIIASTNTIPYIGPAIGLFFISLLVLTYYMLGVLAITTPSRFIIPSNLLAHIDQNGGFSTVGISYGIYGAQIGIIYIIRFFMVLVSIFTSQIHAVVHGIRHGPLIEEVGTLSTHAIVFVSSAGSAIQTRARRFISNSIAEQTSGYITAAAEAGEATRSTVSRWTGITYAYNWIYGENSQSAALGNQAEQSTSQTGSQDLVRAEEELEIFLNDESLTVEDLFENSQSSHMDMLYKFLGYRSSSNSKPPFMMGGKGTKKSRNKTSKSSKSNSKRLTLKSEKPLSISKKEKKMIEYVKNIEKKMHKQIKDCDINKNGLDISFLLNYLTLIEFTVNVTEYSIYTFINILDSITYHVSDNKTKKKNQILYNEQKLLNGLTYHFVS